ncbi:uncharacterized protein EMH_0086750 [Eimeria mitis]|uniref:Uncharacterized protein n=1 Tax=Eimeria mitis TaxID=44415 RepID=U6K7N8_9EIME|nr:uncharacterized protein EMH_0086750 [Eimeria mitis]CDJ33964.1 hypothetical protein EMH_0086750 [Eimeria mitis]
MTSVQDVALPSCGLRGMAASTYMRVESVDRRGWMGTQWWRDWLMWGLGDSVEFCGALECVEARTSLPPVYERLRPLRSTHRIGGLRALVVQWT